MRCKLCAGLRWFALVCAGLRWFALVCAGLRCPGGWLIGRAEPICFGILPEWSKGADLRSARRLSAWVQTPQVPSYAVARELVGLHTRDHTPAVTSPRHSAPPPLPILPFAQPQCNYATSIYTPASVSPNDVATSDIVCASHVKCVLLLL